jgi:autotransporter-associated beta strand protein
MKTSRSRRWFDAAKRRSGTPRTAAAALGAMVLSQPCHGANWDGDAPINGGITYFNWDDRLNFYGNSDPAWSSATPLYFSYNNSGHSTLNQNIGWKDVQSIIYESTFTGSTTLQGSDGFNLYWKIENFAAGHHTVNVPISVKGIAFEINPLSGDLTVGGTITNNDNRTLQVFGNNGKTLTLNSVHGGSGGLTLHQNSTVILTNSNTYTGQTTISGGKLTVGTTGTINSTSGVSIGAGEFNYNNSTTSLTKGVSFSGSGGTLSGTGAINTAVTVNSGNTYTPGAKGGTGEQSINNSLTFNTGSIFDWDVTSASAFDKVTGLTSLSKDAGTGGLFNVVTDMSSPFWTSSQTFSAVFNTGNLSDIFSSFQLNGTSLTNGLVAGKGTFTFSGSNVEWAAIPEPTTALAGLLLAAGLLRRRR